MIPEAINVTSPHFSLLGFLALVVQPPQSLGKGHEIGVKFVYPHTRI